MTRWLLLDYGQVLCTAPPAAEWEQLAEAAGYPDPDRFHEAYWRDRAAYDRADLTAEQYWERVAPDGGLDRVDLVRVRRLDVGIWMHPHQPSVEAAARARGRGWRLALFSNAPVDVAAGIDALEWLEDVERRFYSCRLRRIKPEPQAYRHVLLDLAAAPDQVVFFDDRPENVRAAEAMGITAHVFTDAAQLDRV